MSKDLPALVKETPDGLTEPDTHMEQTFKAMSERAALVVPKTKEFKRQEVIDAFRHSFELIGGIPRLAAWAHHHPTEFYKLYGKLLPTQSQHDVGGADGVLRIVHSLAPGTLDVAPQGTEDKTRVIEHGDVSGTEEGNNSEGSKTDAQNGG